MNYHTPITLSGLGPLITSVRIESGLSQKQLAQELGVSSPAVSKWEAGVLTPTMKHFLALMSVCNKQIYYVNQ